MKKFLLFFLIAVMFLSFIGCDSKINESEGNASEAVTASESSDEHKTESSAETASNTDTPSAPSNMETPSEKHASTPSKAYTASTKAAVVPTNIIMTDNEITLDKNHTWTVKYKLTPSNASASYITFSSSDTSMVTVSKTGVITPVKTSKGGTATITASLPNGFTATMKVNIIYHEPVDSETLKDALAKKGVSIPSFASAGKLGSGFDDEVTCEYAVWANGSNGAKYSNDAYIDMSNNSSTITITITVCIKVNKAPGNGTITLKRDYYGNEKLETINVKTGDLIQKTYTLILNKGGSNKVYHLTLLRNPLNLSTRVYSISSAFATAAFS